MASRYPDLGIVSRKNNNTQKWGGGGGGGGGRESYNHAKCLKGLA